MVIACRSPKLVLVLLTEFADGVGLEHKKVNCKDYGANLTLKTLRYSHKCSNLEDQEIKPKPKAKSKVKAVPIQTTQTQNEVINETPTSVKPRILQEPQQPVIMKSPMSK